MDNIISCCYTTRNIVAKIDKVNSLKWMVMLALHAFKVCGQGNATPSADSEVFKCWFGDELEVTCKDSGCPQGYLCVQRYHHLLRAAWSGCCPAGNGSCHQAMQQGDPGLADYMPPSCATDGTYMAQQCHFAGCFCALSDGTEVPGTFNEYGAPGLNCSDIVLQMASSASGENVNTAEEIMQEGFVGTKNNI